MDIERRWHTFFRARRAWVLVGIFQPVSKTELRKLLALKSTNGIESILLAMDRYGFQTYEEDNGDLCRYRYHEPVPYPGKAGR